MKKYYSFGSCVRMARLTFLFLFIALSAPLSAQLTVTSAVTSTQLINALLGGGLNVSNVTLNCPGNAYGTFSNGNTTNMGLTNGILLTTGSATNAIGPNNIGSQGTCNGTSTVDAQLTAIEPLANEDVCVLEFDLVPQCNTLTIRFVFGSEEYPEFVNSSYNDAFGFFITGPGPACQAGFYNNTNVATLPNNTTPVSIDNVNATTNNAYYVNNAGGPTIQYDAFTTVLTRNVALCPCQTYHFKLAIADAGDCNYDSGVFVDFIQCGTALTATSAFTPPTGCSTCDGTATANASAGSPPYSYSWAPSGGNAATATGLCPGTYTCTITDSNPCSVPETVVVTIPSNGGITSTLSAQGNVSCSGGSDGSATVSGSGGTGTYTYSWAPSGGTGATATGLAAGTYTVTLTDGAGCTTTQTVTITQPAALSATTSGTDPACFGGNGSATASPSGGTPGYTYAWSPSGGTAATATGLAAGNYTVNITDANGCATTQTVSLTEPPVISVSASSLPATCGGTNGSATATSSGGTGAYTYSWAPSGGTAATATGLSAGTYTVTVTDANGCSMTQSVNVTQTNALTSTTSVTNVMCFGGTSGSATATPTAGNPPYTYVWSSGGTNATETGLGAGTYTVTITDAGGCTGTEVVTISEPTQLASALSSTDVSCNGGTDGTATVTANGGTPGYTYAWAPSGGSAATETGLGAGTFTCTVTDANGCTTTQQVTISQPSALTATSSGTNVSCAGGNDGDATVSASGGTPGYTYAWAPSGGTGATATGLGAGSYTCTITDANGCATTQSFTVTQPAALTATSAQTNVLCNGGTTGTAGVTAAGGTPGYTYAWLPSGGTGATASGLGAGTFTCTVTDANGCSMTQTFAITQPQPLTATATGDSACPGGSAAISAGAGGGVGPYSYAWSNGGTTSSQNVTVTQTTTFTVTITDANGCVTTGSATAAVLASPNAAFTTNAVNGTLALGSGGTQLCFTDASTGAIAWAWDLNGTGTSGQQSPCVTVTSADTGLYCAGLVVTNASGCVDTAEVCILIGESHYSIPNVFTPNGDGSNDGFVITNSGMQNLRCEIYDRWGRMVYEWDSTTGYWNGITTGGDEAVDGVYYYVAYLVDFSGKEFNEHGFVHLIRGTK